MISAFLSYHLMKPLDFPPTQSHSPSTSPRCADNLCPRRHPTQRVSVPPPRHASSNAAANLVPRNEFLPFSIYNILTREELIFSMETQVNKLVLTYVSAQLKTLAITIISCLGKVRKLELVIGMKGGALGLRLLKLVRWWWVGVEGAWEAVVMFHHDWEWECVMELLGLRMSRRDFAFSSVIGRSQVGHVRVMLGVEAWAKSAVSITDCCG